jgi:hypothetical protein
MEVLLIRYDYVHRLIFGKPTFPAKNSPTHFTIRRERCDLRYFKHSLENTALANGSKSCTPDFEEEKVFW